MEAGSPAYLNRSTRQKTMSRHPFCNVSDHQQNTDNCPNCDDFNGWSWLLQCWQQLRWRKCFPPRSPSPPKGQCQWSRQCSFLRLSLGQPFPVSPNRSGRGMLEPTILPSFLTRGRKIGHPLDSRQCEPAWGRSLSNRGRRRFGWRPCGGLYRHHRRPRRNW